MRTILLAVLSTLLLAGCGTEGSDQLDIDAIRDRLDLNSCRINREKLVFALGDLEFMNDTTYAELPLELLADSLVQCPVTGDAYQLLRRDGGRVVQCPAGHGETKF